jgi:hypothetical protein
MRSIVILGLGLALTSCAYYVPVPGQTAAVPGGSVPPGTTVAQPAPAYAYPYPAYAYPAYAYPAYPYPYPYYGGYPWYGGVSVRGSFHFH